MENDACGKEIKIIEAHAHLLMEKPINDTVNIFKEYMKVFGCEKIALLSLPYAAQDEAVCLTQNIYTIYCKSKLQGRAYAFGSLYHKFDERDCGKEYLRQVKDMAEQGFDGVKMFEGKPSLRKRMARRLDDSIYDLFYEFCEKERIPIIIHLADPAVFWDMKNIDKEALKNGWFCDNSYPEKAELHREFENVMKKFPHLCVTVAHFAFLTDNISYASFLLDKYENLKFDLVPNPYEFADFSKSPDIWKEFFIKYNNRIIYGTDSYNIEMEKQYIGDTIDKIHKLITSHDKIQFDKVVLCGFDLPNKIAENIYYNNFYDTTGAPHNINKTRVLENVREIMKNEIILQNNNAVLNLKTILNEL